MAQNDFPKVMYHTAIRHRRNLFGRALEGFDHSGDLVNPNYPHPEKGNAKLHYRTVLVAVYDSAGSVNEKASQAEMERLKAEGWVTDPNLLKEEYED